MNECGSGTGSYNFTVTIKKDTRSASASVSIDVANKTAPINVLIDSTSGPFKTNPDAKLSIMGYVKSSSSSSSSSSLGSRRVNISWSMVEGTLQGGQVRLGYVLV